MAIYDGPALLAKQLTKHAHLLVPGLGDQELSENARTVLKVAFNDSLENESKSFPHLSQLMASLTPEAAPTTRSASKKKKQQHQQTSTAVAKLDKTPLDALTLDGLDDETVWEQMELRNKTVDSLLGDMFGTNGVEEQGSDDGAGFDDQSESDEDEAMSDGEEEDSEEEQDEEDSEEEDYESEEYSKQLENDAESGSEDDDDADADARRRDLNLDNFDEPLPSSSKKRRGPASAVDDDFFSLAEFHQQTDEGELEMERALRGEADDDEDDEQDKEDDFDLFADVGTLQVDDDEEEGDLDEAGIMYSDFFDPPTRRDSKKVAQRKQTKGKKAGPVTNGKKRPSSAVEKASNDADAEVVEQEPPRKKTKVRFSDAVRVKTIAPRKQTAFEKLAEQIGEVKARQAMEESLVNGDEDGEDEDDYVDSLDLGEDESGEDEGLDDDAEQAGSDSDEEEQDEEEDDDPDEDSDLEQEAEAIDRFKSDLFAEDDDEDEEDKANLSKQERKLMALSSQIAALEAENVGPKNWATRGEAKAKDRPVNSLLEEDLEFERAGKVVPIITEETTKTIEDIIKQRILDNNFDDVERRRPVDPNAFLPSRYLEVQDTKSGKSLAEIYEEDFVNAREREAGRKVTHALDADLEKKHKEIEDLFEDLSGKLDALSNAHFTPKPPKATITTISNLPAISMESAMPTTQSSAARLAPEEVHVPDPADADRSDLTPAQKRAERQKKRKQRAEQAKKREQFVSDKEKARKSLLGTRGVTVLGKAGNVNGNPSSQQKKKQKKDAKASQTVPSSVAMKL